MPKILLTGCAGFIGHHLAGHLLSQGHEVVGVDNLDDYYSSELKRQNLSTVDHRPGFNFIYGDLLDPSVQQEAFKGRPDIVVHLAGRAGVRPSVQHPELYVRNNVAVTTELLQLAAQHQVQHFLFASSSSVYGNQEKVPFSEDDPVDRPVSPYAATKRACEIISHSFHHLHGLNVTALRFFTVYGPRQRPEMAFPLFTRALLNDQPLTLFGEGTERDYTYIDDIVRGVYLVMQKPLGYRIVNLGNSQPISLAEVVSVLERLTGRTAVVRREPLPAGDVQRTYADITRAADVYGFRPQISLEQGLERYLHSLEPQA